MEENPGIRCIFFSISSASIGIQLGLGLYGMYTWSATAKILKQLHLIDGLHGIVAKNLIWKFALEGCSICLERFTQLVEKQHFLPAKNAHRVFSSVTPRANANVIILEAPAGVAVSYLNSNQTIPTKPSLA
ncbi:hypothetical protein C5167_039561 [Papaver somniferum]|uniref:Uncharacterized protein n=1 Tax=Papaver somniferum TaxID=3469 RepID=A0A4Y7IGQ5_PAPSO|nr:hypothetical protein C5167_039561 [Papaver somniferum]